jgi:hypothetical protein
MISQEKPFNPILGETYEGNVADFNIFCEQISHHPPIASVILKGDNLTLYGTYEYAAKTSPNSVKGKKKGNTHIVFNDEKRTHYELSHPILFISVNSHFFKINQLKGNDVWKEMSLIFRKYSNC